MKLVFYSGGRTPQNHLLHDALFQLTGARKRASFTYVPFCTEGAAVYFGRARARYRKFGFHRFEMLAIDGKVDKDQLERALQSDVIYLSGGNTFYFLKHLKRSRMMGKLRAYCREGGVIAGLSAGGLIMTPNIQLAAYPPFDADDNEIGLSDLKSLNLVSFEFFPHYVNSKRFKEALQSYSALSDHIVYAIKDGGGIVVDGRKLSLVGGHEHFFKGMVLPSPHPLR